MKSGFVVVFYRSTEDDDNLGDATQDATQVTIQDKIVVFVDPDGFQVERYVSASGRVVFDDFNDHYPEGTWQIYIYNRGSVFTDVSAASAGITVYYGYDSYA